jgi:hypothetical protein
MIHRLGTSMLIAGLIAAPGPLAAETPSADVVIDRAIGAVETASTLADHDMIRVAVNQEETTSDGKLTQKDLTAVLHGGRLENIRLELGGGITVVLNGTTGWATVRGQLDTRPQTPRMAAGTIRQTIFPLLLPYSLRMEGVEPGVVTAGSFDGTPAWIVEVTFEDNFFAAPTMMAPWNIYIGRDDHRLLGADYLPAKEFRSAFDEGIRYRFLKWESVDGIDLAAHVLMDGIDLDGMENGHVRVTKISSLTAGPLDLGLFIHPDDESKLDEVEF